MVRIMQSRAIAWFGAMARVRTIARARAKGHVRATEWTREKAMAELRKAPGLHHWFGIRPGLLPWHFLGLMLGLGVQAWVRSKASIKTIAWVRDYTIVKRYGAGYI